MAPRRGNSHIEFRSMLRIISVVIHYIAPISLDIFISYLSQIMAIFYFKKSVFLIFKKMLNQHFVTMFGPNYL